MFLHSEDWEMLRFAFTVCAMMGMFIATIVIAIAGPIGLVMLIHDWM